MPHLDAFNANWVVMEAKEVLLTRKAEIYATFYVVRCTDDDTFHPFARVTVGPSRVEIGRACIGSDEPDEYVDRRKVYTLLDFTADTYGTCNVIDILDTYEYWLSDVEWDFHEATRYNSHQPSWRKSNAHS